MLHLDRRRVEEISGLLLAALLMTVQTSRDQYRIVISVVVSSPSHFFMKVLTRKVIYASDLERLHRLYRL